MNTNQEGEDRVPILAYHSIDSTGSVISISQDKFRSHMQSLADNSFKAISLKEIVKCMCENIRFPKRSVAITFDDGFKNTYELAFPILREFGFKATVFLVPEYCGKNNQWKRQPAGIPSLDLLNWNEILEMAKDGIDFGVHTMNHPDLTGLLLDQAIKEIDDSKRMIEERLAKDTFFFAYPYGRYSDEIKGIIKNKFYGACSTKLDFVSFKSDIYLLPRIDMYYFSKNDLFKWFGTPSFWPYIKLRALLRLFKRIFIAG